ncbi:MAG: PhoPQ-activated pathogenicity-like protein PqaA type, partial [Proteobacteria bacterium]|nr:PhoPQ-activated pathogenicity-like protein PqaA type [Pseudomonadota bacterium]
MLQVVVLCSASGAEPHSENLLTRYLSATDQSYAWGRKGEKDGFVELELTSQTWRSIPWRHSLLVFGQPDVRSDAPVFLFLTGGSAKSEDLESIKTVAKRGRVIVALLTQVPNQPLFEGKKEDGLVAFSFEQYVKSGEADWPVIFPMVKSVARAMDALTAFTNGTAKKFVVSGASKRGWISYLIAAVDPRVVAIAPRVFEMVNMRAQARWQKEVYGKHSEKLRDFTDLGLVERLESEPRLAELSRWVDPWEYRGVLRMPKLVLLGTNDPYWVVDAQRWYWGGLLGPKSLVQFPNLGHNLGTGAIDAIATWAEYLTPKREFPGLSWEIVERSVPDQEASVPGSPRRYRVRTSALPSAAYLWKACAVTRDLREA